MSGRVYNQQEFYSKFEFRLGLFQYRIVNRPLQGGNHERPSTTVSDVGEDISSPRIQHQEDVQEVLEPVAGIEANDAHGAPSKAVAAASSVQEAIIDDASRETRQSNMHLMTTERSSSDHERPTRTIISPGTPQEHTMLVSLTLVTCVHGKFRADSPDFATFIVFKLEIEGSNQVRRMKTSFVMQDSLETSEVIDSAGSPGVRSSPIFSGSESPFRSGVQWMSNTHSTWFFLGMSIRRASSDQFYGVIKFRLEDTQSMSIFQDNRRRLFALGNEVRVRFDPNKPPHGIVPIMDWMNLEASAGFILEQFRHDNTETLSLVSGPGNTGNPPVQARPDIETDTTPPRERDLDAANTRNQPVQIGPNTGTDTAPPLDIELEAPPRRAIQTVETVNFGDTQYERIGVGCIRSRTTKLNGGEVLFGGPLWRIPFIPKGSQQLEAVRNTSVYVVLGIFHQDGFLYRERLVRLGDRDRLDTVIKWAIVGLRGIRGFLSLKSVSGFSLYECDSDNGFHQKVELSQHSQHIMRDFYASYKSRKFEDWRSWIETQLNAGSADPAKGRYSIEILTTWSLWRLFLVTVLPVALRFSVGLWYQATHKDSPETAWVIGTYIVAAAAVIIALLGTATSLGKV